MISSSGASTEPGYFGAITLTGILLEIVDLPEEDPRDHEHLYTKVLCSHNGMIKTIAYVRLMVIS